MAPFLVDVAPHYISGLGLAKISLHAMLSVLVLQGDALAKVQADRLGELRAYTRKVA